MMEEIMYFITRWTRSPCENWNVVTWWGVLDSDKSLYKAIRARSL